MQALPPGILQDSSTGAITLWSAETLHEVTMTNEGQDMWPISLEHQVRASTLNPKPSSRDSAVHVNCASCTAGPLHHTLSPLYHTEGINCLWTFALALQRHTMTHTYSE